MFKSFKYRIYPTEKQRVLIEKHINCCRFIYNLALEAKIMAYSGNKVFLTCFDLINEISGLRKEHEWLKEVNVSSLQAPIKNLDNAFNKFFKKQAKFPKFKKRKANGKFDAVSYIRVKGNKLYIIKFKEGIKINLHREHKGKIKNATISKTPTGKYFASLLCDIDKPLPKKKKIKAESTIGIDLGIKSFLVTSEGEAFKNPKYLRKAQSKLQCLHRKYSKYKGKRTKKRLALAHEKVANQRKDFLHKTSTQLIRDNQTICIEDLNVKGMLKNHCLAQAVTDVSWSMFVDMLKYKADWYGNNLLQISRFEPSSKTCSNCGNINKELTLKDREWTCKACGEVLDRDVNASINIKNFALKNLSVGCRRKNQNELPSLEGVLTSEAQIVA